MDSKKALLLDNDNNAESDIENEKYPGSEDMAKFLSDALAEAFDDESDYADFDTRSETKDETDYADANVSEAAAETADEKDETASDGDSAPAPKSKTQLMIEAALNAAFEVISRFGYYLIDVFIKALSIPVLLITRFSVFVWDHTDVFRDTMKRLGFAIASFFISPIARMTRMVQKNRAIAKQALEDGDKAKAAKVNRFIVKELLIGRSGILPTIANYAAPIISIVFLVGIVTYATGTSYALKLTVNGKFIGYVENEQVFTEAEKLMQERITYADGEEQPEIVLTPKYSIEMLGDQDKISKYQLVNKLMEVSKVKIEYAYGVYIGTTFYGAVLDTTRIDSEIDKILSSYSTGARDEIVTPEKEISYVPGLYLSNSIINEQEIIDILRSNKKEASYYTVEENDSVSLIAYKLAITEEELTELNPRLKEEDYVLKVGEKLLITTETPFLTVSVSRLETYTVDVPYKTEYTTDSDHYQGVKTVVRPGVNGQNSVTARVYYVNGVEKKRDIQTTMTVLEPITEIISEGTKAPQSTHYTTASADSGKKYIWPVVTKDLWEWGWWDGGYYGHTGVDIGGIYGSDIYAGASGEVTYAGWDNGGYGNMVIILHPDGYSTLYAHCSAVFVHVGQKVTQGECIAALGSTGRSFGDHCHFEVRLGSERLNPKYYLSGLPS